MAILQLASILKELYALKHSLCDVLGHWRVGTAVELASDENSLR